MLFKEIFEFINFKKTFINKEGSKGIERSWGEWGKCKVSHTYSWQIQMSWVMTNTKVTHTNDKFPMMLVIIVYTYDILTKQSHDFSFKKKAPNQLNLLYSQNLLHPITVLIKSISLWYHNQETDE